MPYVINTEADLNEYNLADLESLIRADEFNSLHGRDRIINPALELELIYAPVGFTCNGA